MNEIKDYRISIKIRNNRILKAIEEAGGSPGQKWCEKNGISYHILNRFIKMSESPLISDGSLSKGASRLCDVLGKLPEELWSNEQLYPLERNFSEIEMDYGQLISLLPMDQQYYLPDFSGIEQEHTKRLLDEVMENTLKPRERQILEMRFVRELTHEQCGEAFDISKDRIRQIECKALRKLRKSNMLGMLADELDIDQGMGL